MESALQDVTFWCLLGILEGLDALDVLVDGLGARHTRNITTDINSRNGIADESKLVGLERAPRPAFSVHMVPVGLARST